MSGGVVAAIPNPIEWVGDQLGNAASKGAEKIFDGVSSGVLATAPDNLARFLQIGEPGSILKLGLFGFVMVPAFILAAILVWIELVVRSSLIYLLVAFSPVILAVRVWPMLRGA